MTILTFISLALATWRVSSLLAEEDGVFTALAMLRHAMGERFDEYSNQYIKPMGDKVWHKLLKEVAEQMTCIWCCTLWIGLAWFILWVLAPKVAFYLSLPFSLSTVAVYINARGIRARKRMT